MATNNKAFKVKNGLDISGTITTTNGTGTSGQFLKSTGTGVTWDNPTGSGTVTSVVAGTYLTGGTITSTGTIAVDATSTNTASKIVARDASGNFSAGTITGTLSGNASTATTATTANSVANALTISSPLTGTSYNGSAAVSIGIPVATSTANGYLSSTDWSTFNSKGSGTVTSVTGTSPVSSSGGTTPAISLASGYGDTQNPYGSKTANYFLAAPNGSAAAPTFRAIVAADIPTLNQNTTGTASNITSYTINQNLGTGNQVTFDSVITGNNGNGTNFRVGDDAWLGDINVANTIRIQGAQNAANAYIVFGNGDSTALGRASTGALTYGGNTILNSSNYTSYSPSLSGSGATGSWGISVTGSSASCTGNAATATSATSATTATTATNLSGGSVAATTGTFSGTVTIKSGSALGKLTVQTGGSDPASPAAGDMVWYY